MLAAAPTVAKPAAPAARRAAGAGWRERLDALPRDARDTLFLLLVIAWVILPQVGNLPGWCSALAAAVLAWRTLLALRGRPLPGAWWLVGLLLAAVVATAVTFRTLLGRDAGVTLIVVLLALKTLELRARRDIFVVFFLGFFTMLTNFFFSQALPVALAMIVGLLGLLTALVNAHMPVGKPPLAQAARTAGLMALLGAPIMAALFLLFPRLAPLWGIPGDAMAGRSGLSATMQVGNLASLALDESIAMRVKFDGAVPAQQDLYFRGPVLSVFDGREWRALGRRGGGLGGAVFQPATARLQVAGTPVRYEVTLEPNNRPWLLVLDAAANAPTLPGMQVAMTSELVWVADRPVTDLLRYRAESYPTFRHGSLSISALLPDYLDLPPGFNPRTLELAAQWRRDPELLRGGAPALVQAALQRLRTGNYRYTLEPGVYGPDTADEFWFDRREGFCEHIASSFVVLMRALGIPARVVTGYQGGARNPVDGFWVVRQSDAHAWTEVWLAGRGWVRVDPTAAVAPSRTGAFQRLQPRPGFVASAIGSVRPELAAQLRMVWEAVNNGWNQWVLNYTQSKQLNLLRNLGFESPSWEDLSLLVLGLIVAVALCGAAWTLWDRRQHDPWLRLLAQVRRRLRQAGLQLPTNAPPREIAAAVTGHYGAAAQPLADWLLKLERQRYGRGPAAPVADLRREFKRTPWPA
jgi:transglutaminase-like putative cysteine protease